MIKPFKNLATAGLFVIILAAIMFFLCNFLPQHTPETMARTVILQNGTKIHTTRFQITQWTFQPGLTIGKNNYAGNYTILIGHVE